MEGQLHSNANDGLSLGLDAVPSVRIEPGRGSDWATHVRIAEWEGPLGLLLSLIEARRLDVLTVPLGGLAESYLEALATIEHDRMTTISSFVAVASQLILIKSRAMLPRPPALPDGTLEDEGADPEAELRARLLLYRAFRDAGATLQAIALDRVGLFRREPAVALASGLAALRAPDDGAGVGPALRVAVGVRAGRRVRGEDGDHDSRAPSTARSSSVRSHCASTA